MLGRLLVLGCSACNLPAMYQIILFKCYTKRLSFETFLFVGSNLVNKFNNKTHAFCFLSDDAFLAFNILHRFTFNTINSAFFSVDSFFVLRYDRMETAVKLLSGNEPIKPYLISL